jgi:glyoxylase-like metal-dependent hydrolase (beta-lactamase superfamily II)
MVHFMNIKTLSVGPFEVNCSIVWNDTNQALVIDPGSDAVDIETVLGQNKLSVAAYLLTHGHADHLSALAELHSEHPAPVVIHAEDFKWAFHPQNQIPPYYSAPAKLDAEFIHPEITKRLDFANMEIRCIETPGHTPGGICYFFEKQNAIFTGDTLFKGACGRTDLSVGDAKALAKSLRKLTELPNNVAVYTGHGESTTIGHENRTNFFMQRTGK